ncbi:sphingosine N-acyltransferase lag1, partial [Entomortierella chlamydospora]
MPTNTAVRPSKNLKSKRPYKKAEAPVFQGIVKSLHLESIFTDDKDLALKAMGVILLGYGLGNSFCKNMVTLSYPVQDELTREGESWFTARFTNGPNDLIFTSFWIIAFTYIRALLMKSYFAPIGKRWGIRGSKLERFEEQMYILVYYAISWSSGM